MDRFLVKVLTRISHGGEQTCRDGGLIRRHIAGMTPFTDRTGRFSPLKTATLIGLAAPAAYLVIRLLANDLGPLPIKEALLVSGLWTVRFLVLTLVLTPAMRIASWPKLALIRRMTGVAAFAYGSLHVTLFVANSKFDLLFVATEIVSRFYLTIGFAALTGLSLLAATSTDGAVRALGKRWKQLHRLVYGIAMLGIWHFFLQSKIDVTEATLMAGLFLLLMIYRLAISRRLRLSLPLLAGCALAAAGVTAVAEFAWYGLGTGVDPWRVAAANLKLAYGLRPAVAVLAIGLVISTLPVLRGITMKLMGTPRLRTA